MLGQTIDSSLSRLKSGTPEYEQESLVLQGVYLFGVRAFEFFLERQMVYLCHPLARWGPKVVNGKTRRYVSKLKDTNESRVKAILAMGSSYADYLPYERTVNRAKVLFAAGRPFSLIDPNHGEMIKRALVVRNLIAHESDHSMRQFQKTVCSRYPLRPDRRNASGYLLHEAIKGVPMAKQDLAGLLDVASFLS